MWKIFIGGEIGDIWRWISTLAVKTVSIPTCLLGITIGNIPCRKFDKISDIGSFRWKKWGKISDTGNPSLAKKDYTGDYMQKFGGKTEKYS